MYIDERVFRSIAGRHGGAINPDCYGLIANTAPMNKGGDGNDGSWH
jgi:hypothetical protein